jgi:hypothetical protein
VRIKSAQRLRNKVVAAGDDRPAPEAKTPAPATQEAKGNTKRHTGEPRATGGDGDGGDNKPMSLLDAAAHLLSLGTGDPMRCKDIVDLAVARGLWAPGKGKTPAATLHAAMSREIKTKGTASRRVKAARGKFGLASKAWPHQHHLSTPPPGGVLFGLPV